MEPKGVDWPKNGPVPGRPVNGYDIRRQPANLGQIDTFGIVLRSHPRITRARILPRCKPARINLAPTG